LQQAGDLQTLVASVPQAQDLINEICEYYDHDEVEEAVAPLLVVVNGKFGASRQGMEKGQDVSEIIKETREGLTVCENLISKVYGTKSEKLVPVYQL